MAKELFVSSTPHETKVAIVEDDQLAEIYFERENEYTLAGSIYKGRVTRVLPGMQSAFVDVGLERDAFLYVSDFFEDQEEYDAVVTRVEEDVAKGSQRLSQPAEARPMTLASETAPPALPAAHSGATSPDDDGSRRWRGRRRRRRGRGGRDFQHAQQQPQSQPQAPAASEAPREQASTLPPPPVARPLPPRPPAYAPLILPGESISKYRRMAESQPTQPTGESAAVAYAAPATASAEATEVSESAPQTAAPTSGQATLEIVGGYAGTSDWENEHPDERQPADSASTQAEETRASSAVAAVPSREELRRSLEIFEQRANEATGLAASPAEGPAAPLPEELPGGWRAPRSEELLEEDEIEEDDAGYYPLAAEEEEVSAEELEEETLDRAAEFGEAHKDSLIERAATGNYETEPPGFASRGNEQDEGEEGEDDAGDEALEETDMVAEGAEAAAPGDGGEVSAELRTAPAVAGFQQRATMPGFDPAKRGGRHRGQRGRGHGRRNIQRGPRPLITDLLKEGQEILVQIAKEPIGKKGARITSHIALPGRYLVYMPTVDHIGVSRKIASDEERQRLKRILASERNGAHGGFIVRTAAAGTSEDELRADIRFLINLWNEIRQRADAGAAPALIYHDLNLVERILRDQVTQTFSHIWVDSEPEYERILRFVSRFQESLVKRVKLYTKDTPLFEQFNIQEEINKALKSKVWLKSGGYIVINQTEALVAVDINTGKYVGKTARLEDTIVKTNVEAIQEIVRQIRLRDLGGIIVIDFIDMDERRNRQKVMQALEEALRGDRAPNKVLQFNDFGLVAITRKRVKQSLERTLGMPCTYCTGTGLIKSVATVCNEIYVEMRKMAKHLEGSEVMLRVHPEVAKNLKANGARLLSELEELTGRTVIVKSDTALHQEQFDIN
ncbi:MAG: Rne/Rng family ribonuclease [Acidobacteria bacterium]|nr:Rne/Rng family ribonuclease [Acidobacteriota bacterium]